MVLLTETSARGVVVHLGAGIARIDPHKQQQHLKIREKGSKKINIDVTRI